MKCKYRLVKVHHIKHNITTYWIQRPVIIFGITMWWQSTHDIPYTDESAVMADLEAMCSESFWEMLEIWKSENSF